MEIQPLINYARNTLQTDFSGHDFYHVQRVAKTAIKLHRTDFVEQNNTTEDLILAASYLHDTIDDKLFADQDLQKQKAQALLKQAQFTPEQIELIMTTISHLSYSDNLQKNFELPLFGQYVQDADRIDALGAIGIARAFAYGGNHQQPIYDPEIKIQELQNKEQYRKHQTSTINHFYEKLLSVKDTINTPAGKKLAQARTDYLRDFLNEFFAEWSD